MNNNITIKKIKILFIIPPYFNMEDIKDTTTSLPSFTIPYGIMSIDAYIKKNSLKLIHSVILDLNIEQYKQKDIYSSLSATLTIYNPDIVAISALFDTSYNYLEPISSTIKKQLPNALVIAGGGLPTNLYKEILETHHHIDAICYGEGEIPTRDLINSYPEDYINLLENHSSWITYTTINTKKPINTLINNLDEIPHLNYNLIDLYKYNSRSLDKSRPINHKREISIHTSRGCPFDCIFCSNGKLHGKEVRFMSVEKVIAEVERMIEEYQLTTLIIEDDNFLFNKERAKEILRQLSKLEIKLEFPNGLAVYAIDEEIATLLKKAGTNTVPLAIESGSDYVLQNIIKKPLKVNTIKEKVEMLRKNNIKVHAFIVTGLPGETHNHRIETLCMLLDIKFDWVHIAIAIPVSGSRLYDICKDKNYLTTNNMSSHTISKSIIKTETFTSEEIEYFSYTTNLYVNFVHNYNMSLETVEGYNTAIDYFQNIVNKYPEHAFARYYLAKALHNKHSKKFHEIIDNNITWKKYTEKFKLDITYNNYDI